MSDAAQFVRSLGLRYFQPWEILDHGLERGNTLPPQDLWQNIALTATVLDELRHATGRPIRITSAYRSPDYNRAIGGTARSQHMAFSALDFKADGIAPAEVGALLRSWRGKLFQLPLRVTRCSLGDVPFAALPAYDERGGERCVLEWCGGVGVYSTFVHVDSRGLPHSWSGR